MMDSVDFVITETVFFFSRFIFIKLIFDTELYKEFGSVFFCFFLIKNVRVLSDEEGAITKTNRNT